MFRFTEVSQDVLNFQRGATFQPHTQMSAGIHVNGSQAELAAFPGEVVC